MKYTRVCWRETPRWKYQTTQKAKFETGFVFGESISTKFIALNRLGTLTIKAGYSWDGATGVPDSSTVLVASLAHDALYQLLRLGLLDQGYREMADKVMAQVMLQEGSWRITASIVYHALRLGGARAAAFDKGAAETIRCSSGHA